ncbi:CDP-alcohol phosphatidyltransferase family protein [Alkalihalobacillus sp. LMS6]|uniref:CDP-alcohol phosphatidyltransferase family protein n=1 Tax=Alkalihalobacillus sp. LMS6 TaxID=2924034 RepID=UPI0020D03B53|nr:CDP-alcohol phosphatidyltransferase family protein [Alkalihalobacillus sp. LMS6]UTR05630.1 CDP-alcohol phosphatidyltransferase family protein [Alkalihalobacillus sp. LMS6]
MMRHKQIASTWFDTKRITALRERSQSYSAKEDLWSWYVLRRLSIFVTILFIKLKLTPNAISWLSAIFVVSSGAWLIQATPVAFLMAFLFYNIGYLLDCVDGEVARLTENTSKKGYFIDLLIQGATLPIFVSMILVIFILNDQLELTGLSGITMYLAISGVIMSLFVPLAYQLTEKNQKVVRDPMNEIRTKSAVFEITGVLLGLPGFFLFIASLSILNILMFIPVSIIKFYIMFFVLSLIGKTILRLYVTNKKLS